MRCLSDDEIPALGRKRPAGKGPAREDRNVLVFLPIGDLSISLPLIIGLGALVGLLSGLLGIGAGFFQTPALIMIGIPPTVATASGAAAIVATSSSGTMAHFRLGHVDFKLGLTVIPGGLLGGLAGVHLIKFMRTTGNADVLILLTYILLLGGVGAGILLDNLQRLRRTPATVPRRHHALRRPRNWLRSLPWQTNFTRAGIRHSALVPFSLGLLIGMLTALMGVSGGFLMLPVMVYLLSVPVHVAVGTNLFQVLFTCSGVAMLQATENHTVDILLVLLLAAGSTLGAQAGARLSRWFRGEQLMLLLAVLILLVFVKLMLSLVLAPASLLSLAAWLLPAAPTPLWFH